MGEGFTLCHTDQCPFTAKYVPLVAVMARARNVAFRTAHIQTREAAQNAEHFFYFAEYCVPL